VAAVDPGETAKWNAAGRSTAMTLMVNNDELSCVVPANDDHQTISSKAKSGLN
jgi:hypothetical protein